MTEHGGLTEEQARALWRRAAELQASAESAVLGGAALRPPAAGTLSIEQVTAAAEGAGIGAEYLRTALAEQRLPDTEDLAHDRWTGRWLRQVIREPHVIEVERVIRADPESVLATFRELASSDTYRLTLEDVVGEDAVRDAVLVYRIRGDWRSSFGSTLNFADVRVLLVTVRPHDEGTLLRIRTPLFRRGVNLLLSGVSAGLFGAGGAGLAGAAATALGASAVVALAPVAAAAGAGCTLGLAAFRGLYRAARKQGGTALTQLVNAVAAEAEGLKRRLPGG